MPLGDLDSQRFRMLHLARKERRGCQAGVRGVELKRGSRLSQLGRMALEEDGIVTTAGTLPICGRQGFISRVQGPTT